MKENDTELIRRAAQMLAPLIPKGCCIVPVPCRNGYANHTLILANEIRKLTGIPVANILVGKSRMSQYHAKQNGKGLTEKDLGFYKIARVPTGTKPIVLDNVVGTGLTGKSAVHALGEGTVLALAMDDSFYIAHQLSSTNNQVKEKVQLQQRQNQACSFQRSY